MNIYLDVCCLNRPFDDQSQDRIRLETVAITMILQLCARGVHKWYSSEVVDLEVSRATDLARRSMVEDLLRFADERLILPEQARDLAGAYQTSGLKPMDALHLAAAQTGGCHILLTTDDGFGRGAKKLAPPAKVRVENPARWVIEAISP